ncbi:MAG: hypothetical protein ACW97Z_10120 [Candidatus Hodarchaeales archaeon]|jgi:hypothetical protein
MKTVNRDILLEKEIIWRVKKGLEFNHESETFLNYLIKEKALYDRYRPLNKLIPIVGVIIGLTFLFLYTSMMLVDFIIIFFLEGQYLGPPDLQSDFFSLLVLTSVLASVLGQILVIFTLSFKYFFTKDNWSKFHDQTISLVERLSEMNLLQEYIQFGTDESGEKYFKLRKLSVDLQVQWIFPFIFNAFPPLLIEIMFLSLLLPFSMATLFSLLIAIVEGNWIIALGMTLVMALIIVGLYSNTLTILRSWSKYTRIRNLMITRQQGILHHLVLTGEGDLTILRNENNLSRLERMHSFPLPSLLRITAFIPLIGSLLGYLVGFTLLV